MDGLRARGRFAWRVLRNALTHSRGVVAWITFSVFFLTLLVGISVASFSDENRRYAAAVVVLLVAYCLFEGAFLTWRDESRRADKSDDFLRAQQSAVHGILHSQSNALNSQLILADHVRRNGKEAKTPEAVAELARSVDDWIAKTGNALESARLDAGPFLADTGDYGTKLPSVPVGTPHARAMLLEIQRLERAHHLKRLDRHVDRLRVMYDRVEDTRQALYKTMWGVEA